VHVHPLALFEDAERDRKKRSPEIAEGREAATERPQRIKKRHATHAKRSGGGDVTPAGIDCTGDGSARLSAGAGLSLY
jgi:hypothetical protein